MFLSKNNELPYNLDLFKKYYTFYLNTFYAIKHCHHFFYSDFLATTAAVCLLLLLLLLLLLFVLL